MRSEIRMADGSAGLVLVLVFEMRDLERGKWLGLGQLGGGGCVCVGGE
jgi:hypothetical protein